MRKVIFLDIDGVLNTEQHRKLCRKKGIAYSDENGDTFDPVAVANLSKIIDETGADIVISSSWKFWGLLKLWEMWKNRKLPGKVIDVTPDTEEDEILLNADLSEMERIALRGYEIKEWLSFHGKKVSRYAIIDNVDSFLPEQQPHFVQVCPITGITVEDAEKVIKVLK